MTKSRTSVLVFVPAFGRIITASTFNATHALMPALNALGIGSAIATHSHPDIAALRNLALSVWHEAFPDHTHLLFVDADMGFPPQLVTDMLAFGEPLVGAIYRKRDDVVSWAASGLPGQPERRGAFTEVDGLGMGCFLIRRDAVDTMIKRLPELVMRDISKHALRDLLGKGMITKLLRFFDPIDAGDEGFVSEDLSFCRRWRSIGGQVWGAGHHVVVHEGPYPFVGCYNAWASAQQAKIDAEKPVLEDAAS